MLRAVYLFESSFITLSGVTMISLIGSLIKFSQTLLFFMISGWVYFSYELFCMVKEEDGISDLFLSFISLLILGAFTENWGLYIDCE